MQKIILPSLLAILAAACATNDTVTETKPAPSHIDKVYAAFETDPVNSDGDAADDPAIWIHPTNPEKSVILGTDKRAGLDVYDLNGKRTQFLPIGHVNNVDIRQNVQIGTWQGDLAVATNLTNNSLTVMDIENGEIWPVGEIPVKGDKPYGICMGQVTDDIVIFATYYPGTVEAYRLTGIGGKNVKADFVGEINLDSEIEGCVVDDDRGTLYVGEENHGIWQYGVELMPIEGAEGVYLTTNFKHSIDKINGASGITDDIEGLDIYKGQNGRYLVASSQGNNSIAFYDLNNNGKFVNRIAVGQGTFGSTEDSDGLAVSGARMGSKFPYGMLVIQDGINGNNNQNFKAVDWRDIEQKLKN